MGGKGSAQITVDQSVGDMLKTIAQATLTESGSFVDQNGKKLDY
jgi:hypothetical protein